MQDKYDTRARVHTHIFIWLYKDVFKKIEIKFSSFFFEIIL